MCGEYVTPQMKQEKAVMLLGAHISKHSVTGRQMEIPEGGWKNMQMW